MTKDPKIVALILAAGESSRMGTPKQLLPWRETTLLGNCIENARKVCGKDVFVVLGAHAERIKKNTNTTNVTSIENNTYSTGLGSSISCGITHLQESVHDCQGVLILLCDQPLIDVAYLGAMIATFKKDKKGIVATSYANRVGVPAIFDAKYFVALKELKKDYGAKKILEKFKDDVVAILPKGKEQDIDTIEAYEILFQKHSP